LHEGDSLEVPLERAAQELHRTTFGIESGRCPFAARDPLLVDQ
jgi:hypothetical protein